MTHRERGHLTRRRFLQDAGLAVAAGVVGSTLPTWARAEDEQRPNVVFVLVDDMGWHDGASLGSPAFVTPNIDRLGREGMTFTNAYAACAVCSPTRAAIMTGRYPARTGITDWIRPHRAREWHPHAEPMPLTGDPKRELLTPENRPGLPPGEVTLAELLGAEGYATCHVGKWHLGPESCYPDQQGFDRNIGGYEAGQPPSYFDPYVNDRAPTYEHGGGIPTLTPQEEGEYLTDREADEAVAFIREHHDAPFFLYMSHYAVHAPIQAKTEDTATFEGREPSAKNAKYAAMVASVDEALGRILSTLDDLDIADNTLVIFTSDNGGVVSRSHNEPLRSGKGWPYEGGLRVPLVVRWPGRIAAGSREDTPVTSVDFLPTITAALGVSAPSGVAVDGADISPLLWGSGAIGRDALFWHFPHYRGDVAPYSIVRSGGWKLIRRYEAENRDELYNLTRDPSETHNLIREYSARTSELDGLLTEWLTSVGGRMPVANPEYDPTASGE
jgi:arylsulfatase A-like enzyme